MNGKACAAGTTNQVRERLFGLAGSKIRIMAQKQSGAPLEVTLTRGDPEWWAFQDWKDRMHADIATREQEVDSLRLRLRDAESQSSRDRQEFDNLNAQIMQLSRQHRKLQVDLENEIEIRKRSESMLTYMSNEKKHSEEQIENLLNKVSEVTLSFKSAQGLAREMTEKARQSEQARANEEKLRKAAETRETRAQSLLLEEIRKAKDLEIEKTILQKRSDELKEMVERLESVDVSGIRQQVHVAERELELSKKEVDRYAAFVDKMQKDNLSLHSALGDVQLENMKLKESLEEGKNKIQHLETALESAVSAKIDALKNESNASALLSQKENDVKAAEGKIMMLENNIKSLQAEVEHYVSRVNEKTADEKRLQMESRAQIDKLVEDQNKSERMLVKKDQEVRGLETKVAALNVQVEDLKQEVLELEAAKSKLQSLVVTKTREHATQVSNFQLEENILREKCFALESDLNRWIKHDKAQQENMADLEHRIDDMNKQIKDLKNQIHQDNKQIIALEEVKKTLMAETSEYSKQVANLQYEVLILKQQGEAMKLSETKMEERSNKLIKEVHELQDELHTRSMACSALQDKIDMLQKELTRIPELSDKHADAVVQVRSLEEALKTMKLEKERALEMLDALRKEHELAQRQFEGFKSELHKQKALTQESSNKTQRQLREEIAALTSERDDLAAELNRFYALPSPCGIGMGISEVLEHSTRIITVSDLAPGQSAQLSGAIRKGDELVAVDGVLAAGQTLDELKGRIAGRRGSKLTLTLKRTSAEDSFRNGREFSVTMKRGCFGPEHCIMEGE
uniref:PDZ domain-containing protein n=1 Tax=Guillardia theta TaxID=55529 RepID=A0A7S4PJ19_GUITH